MDLILIETGTLRFRLAPWCLCVGTAAPKSLVPDPRRVIKRSRSVCLTKLTIQTMERVSYLQRTIQRVQRHLELVDENYEAQ